ncbi:hypothetical protein GQ55_8G088800 [Panicum hallii var. hallii]|uniref:Secreted protein n=1 Tax=Panicum hallii var. hallii TaxID=1504633 RepID=A0A2T7CM52_9POAL|nr:hypothetical protein GQ55_8G088800 [Panicum hallii var. hallii]
MMPFLLCKKAVAFPLLVRALLSASTCMPSPHIFSLHVLGSGPIPSLPSASGSNSLPSARGCSQKMTTSCSVATPATGTRLGCISRRRQAEDGDELRGSISGGQRAVRGGVALSGPQWGGISWRRRAEDCDELQGSGPQVHGEMQAERQASRLARRGQSPVAGRPRKKQLSSALFQCQACPKVTVADRVRTIQSNSSATKKLHRLMCSQQWV